ncbi:carboxypeptidase regulatory-like domain-containing protein [Gimesia chilikensis]|uniref:carboxypeptidase-like regulatory domain-containing protein n=1 Tax=Gimesia chilikensis TaxID=2605989 RepID=UPI0011EE9D82|nr:carboxypeptidase-like regulatory domain-containing protein [Gimesia chilikensis]KAA0137334.1 carboxypeptidase regulatory-like domain-containing protein [Gimesia chilikensis]
MSACLDTMRQLTRGIAILFAVMSAALSGCGGSASGPDIDMIPVTGSVTMDGEPLVGAMVEFHPTGGTKGNGAFGLTDEAGKFTLTDYHSNPGCPPGEYGVTFSKITLPDGSPIPPDSQQGGVGMKEQIPPGYNLFKPHAIIQAASVKAPESTFEFQLDSKFKPPQSFYHE